MQKCMIKHNMIKIVISELQLQLHDKNRLEKIRK